MVGLPVEWFELTSYEEMWLCYNPPCNLQTTFLSLVLVPSQGWLVWPLESSRKTLAALWIDQLRSEDRIFHICSGWQHAWFSSLSFWLFSSSSFSSLLVSMTKYLKHSWMWGYNIYISKYNRNPLSQPLLSRASRYLEQKWISLGFGPYFLSCLR